MATTETIQTLADLLEQLGGISADRVRFRPAPGMATEADVIATQDREGRTCELIDGVLVEKAMGIRESILAAALILALGEFVKRHNLGFVTAPDGLMRLAPRLVRAPDVSFVSWDRFPDRRLPAEPIPDVAPDLAAEILSPRNTYGEVTRKRREYFEAGVRLAWLVDPDMRTVEVCTAVDQSTVLRQHETLTGGEVLPGFALPLADFFAEFDRHG